MKTSVEDFQEAIEDLQASDAYIILEKAKAAYNYCAFNKNAPAHRQSKTTPTEDIANLTNKHSKFIDRIYHPDGAITLITSDKFYLRFYNL